MGRSDLVEKGCETNLTTTPWLVKLHSVSYQCHMRCKWFLFAHDLKIQDMHKNHTAIDKIQNSTCCGRQVIRGGGDVGAWVQEKGGWVQSVKGGTAAIGTMCSGSTNPPPKLQTIAAHFWLDLSKLSSPKKHSQSLQYMHYLQSFLQFFSMSVSHPSSCLLISPMCDYFGKLGPLKLGNFVM